MFEVLTPSPIQRYRISKRKRTPAGTMEINPKRQKYHISRKYSIFLWGRCIVARITLLPVSRKFKRRCISELWRSRMKLKGKQKERDLWKISVSSWPTSDVTSTSRDSLYTSDCTNSVYKYLTLFHSVSRPYHDTTIYNVNRTASECVILELYFL